MNWLKKIYLWTFFFIGVPTCVGCGEPLDNPYSPICPSCAEAYAQTKTERCSRCNKLLYNCNCTNEYLANHFIKKHFKVFRYQNREENTVANSLIYSLKLDNRMDVVDFLCDELAESIADFVRGEKAIVFTNVPRRRKSTLKYGMDHAQELAKGLARRFGAEYRDILISRAKTPQKRLRGVARKTNASFDYKSRRPQSLEGKTVVIVDDVVTTGSSIANAGALIRALGAKKIVAASLAATYKDAPDALRKAELEMRRKRKKKRRR